MRVRNDGRIGDEREIVPIKRDIQFSDRDGNALDLLNIFGQPLGERNAAGLDADETEVFGAVILLNDLVGDAHKRPLHGGLVHDLRFEGHCHTSFPSSGQQKNLGRQIRTRRSSTA